MEERDFELDDTNRAPRGIWSDRAVIWLSDSGRNRLFAHRTPCNRPSPDGERGDNL